MTAGMSGVVVRFLWLAAADLFKPAVLCRTPGARPVMVAVAAHHPAADLIHERDAELVGKPTADRPGARPVLGGSAPAGGIEGHDEPLAVLSGLREQALRGLPGGGLEQFGHEGAPAMAALTAASVRIVGEVVVEPMAGPDSSGQAGREPEKGAHGAAMGGSSGNGPR